MERVNEQKIDLGAANKERTSTVDKKGARQRRIRECQLKSEKSEEAVAKSPGEEETFMPGQQSPPEVYFWDTKKLVAV